MLSLLAAVSTVLAKRAVATEADIFAGNEAARPDYVKQLEESFGLPSQNGFGSTVLYATAKSREELEGLAKLAYRHFTGELWDKWGETAWMGQWRIVHERTTQRDIMAELRALDDPLLRSSVDMLLDGTENPASGKGALSAAFDDLAVHNLLIFAIGDGGAMSGLLVAVRRANDEATFVVFLMD